MDCRQISAIFSVAEQEKKHPGVSPLKEVEPFQDWIDEQGDLDGFKDGAKTGLTCGKIIKVGKIVDGQMQLGWVDAIPHGSSSKILFHRFRITFQGVRARRDSSFHPRIKIIKWGSQSEPFAEDGDSGSIIYAKANDCIMPLEIHSMSLGDINTAYLFHSWWEELEKIVDADIYFCDTLRCLPSDSTTRACRVVSRLGTKLKTRPNQNIYCL